MCEIHWTEGKEHEEITGLDLERFIRMDANCREGELWGIFIKAHANKGSKGASPRYN